MTPEHLAPIAGSAELDRLLLAIDMALPAEHYATGAELRAFQETRTRHDARRLVNALRHVSGLLQLADELDLLARA